MRRISAWFAAAALTGALFAGTRDAHAAITKGSGDFGFYAGWYWPDNAGTGDNFDSATYGLRGGYNINPKFGFDLQAGRWVGSDGSGLARIDITGWFFDTDFVWHVNPDSKAVFQVYGGPGWAKYDVNLATPGKDFTDDGLSWNAGLGGQFFCSDSFFIRVDGKARWYDFSHDMGSLTNYEGTVTFGWQFGGGK